MGFKLVDSCLGYQLPMIVFAYWSSAPDAPERQAELISLWVRDCISQGRIPRLLTARDAQKSVQYKRAVKKGAAGKFSLDQWALKAQRVGIAALVDLEEYRPQL